MMPVVRHALGWGTGIGLANMAWLYAAYFLGLHTGGVMAFQIFMVGWLALTAAGFFFALRSMRRSDPSLSYWRGVGAGAVAALASAVVAVVAQVGYFKLVHPAWPEVMAQQTRAHFAAEGLSPVQVDARVAQAREFFTLSNYAVSSFATALVLGVVLSAVFMAALRRSASAGEPAAA